MTDMNRDRLLLTLARSKSALFALEGLLGPAIEFATSKSRPRLPGDDPELLRAVLRSLDEILREDVKNIRDGVYPVRVLAPENPLRHLLRMPRLLRVGIDIARRRRERSAHEFSDSAEELLADVPDYYRRNFHFQGDGYLSDESADLYDHQVDILFAGAADPMRRLLLAPMRRKFADRPDGEGLTFLELGAGTGRATRFVRLAFPKAKIVAIDLSAPYLKKAQSNLAEFPRHDFVEADATNLPFKDESFDAVYSVFLFHELPKAEREKVLRESKRLLRANGFHALVDSLQLGDVAELDRALENFPREFHEPFYRDYVGRKMESMVEEVGFVDVEARTGFFSKVVTSSKSAT